MRNWLLTSIPNEWVCDQFGFRSTGSSACALTFMLHYRDVTAMLEDCEYVLCLLIDFSNHLMLLIIQYYCLHFPSSICHYVYLTGSFLPWHVVVK